MVTRLLLALGLMIYAQQELVFWHQGMIVVTETALVLETVENAYLDLMGNRFKMLCRINWETLIEEYECTKDKKH